MTARRQLQVWERQDDGTFSARGWTIDDELWEALQFERLAEILGQPTVSGIMPADAAAAAQRAAGEHGSVMM